jgi:hypothetical protein
MLESDEALKPATFYETSGSGSACHHRLPSSLPAFGDRVGDGPPKPRDEKSTIAFQDATRTSRIDFTLRNSISPQRYSIETMAGGVALFDYNNDGLLDIFFTNGRRFPPSRRQAPISTIASFATTATAPLPT